jgi:hypothetical protein
VVIIVGDATSRPPFVLFNAALELDPMQSSKHENYAYTHMQATKHTLHDNQNHIKYSICKVFINSSDKINLHTF